MALPAVPAVLVAAAVVTQDVPVVAAAERQVATTVLAAAPVVAAPVVAAPAAAHVRAVALVGAPTPGADLLAAASVVVVVIKTSCSPRR